MKGFVFSCLHSAIINMEGNTDLGYSAADKPVSVWMMCLYLTATVLVTICRTRAKLINGTIITFLHHLLRSASSKPAALL
ncbi:hypothetical protein GDO78_013671 [Eleutherodactylus coqui]|uniref:Uncharacterized protein n=1 Tax=Eleutherodactylus coqui TaxID=57060 RepID=A0A8J6EMM3_ELECQ|nr:hypothetical protein GDO78_013671 [Eleutherodactylus coqui]